MSQPFVGEIRMFGGSFAPLNWSFCDGSLLPIDQYDTLFSLIGTTYGGDGQQTFALPNLSGRVPIHQGQGVGLSPYVIGQIAGTETVTLTGNQIPIHAHAVAVVSADGSQPSPSGGYFAASSLKQYTSNAANATMNPATVGLAGGSQPHDNMPPFQAVSFIISLFGIYPSQG
jgi:microcystin-dependent protein